MGNTFQKDLELSYQLHREYFKPLYNDWGWIIAEVEDQILQDNGVDVIAIHDGQYKFIEQKADRWADKTHNLAFEINNRLGEPTGWISKTPISRNYEIHYLLVESKTLYIFDFYQLHYWFFKNEYLFRKIETSNLNICALVPIKDIPENCIKSIVGPMEHKIRKVTRRLKAQMTN